MEITNVIFRDQEGAEFDFEAEGVAVQIIEVFEDGITFADHLMGKRTYDCKFEGHSAVVEVSA